jgi:hypothetical protein
MEMIPTSDLGLGLLGAGALCEGRCCEKRNKEAKVPQVEHHELTSLDTRDKKTNLRGRLAADI